MAKGNPKTSVTGKGQKRKCDNKPEQQAQADQVMRSKERLDLGDGVFDNENKQKKRKSDSVVKRLNFDSSMENRKELKVKQDKRAKENLDMTVEFEEDGEEFTFKVAGQATDFASETEDGELDGQQSDLDDEVILSQSRNNNATQDHTDAQPGTSSGISDYGNVQIRPRDTEVERKEEEEGMQRFIDYMKKQGLMLVETTKALNAPPHFEEMKKQAGMTKPQQGMDNESIIIVYRNAVHRSEPSEKRNSSSLEEVDTSDEQDKLVRPEHINVRTEQINVSQFLAENPVAHSSHG